MPDRCEVLPGDNIVARRAGGLLWVDAPGSPALVAGLHACLGVRGPGAEQVLTAIAGQVRSLADRGASFALVVTDPGDGTGAALWSGEGRPAVDGTPLSGRSVEGCQLATGLDLGSSVYVGPGSAPSSSSPGVAFDLVEGTVPGGGATVLLAAGAPAAGAPPRSPASPASADAVGPAGSSAQSSSARSDVSDDVPGAPQEPAAGPPSQAGEQTAFWQPDPDAEPTPSAPPVLRFDDGMVVTVDNDLVLGRRPDGHELVTSGDAVPVPIADTQNVLSSAHAAIRRSGEDVNLIDLGSLNGTHVAGPEATEWTQLEPGVAHALADGDRLLLGWTVITFELAG